MLSFKYHFEDLFTSVSRKLQALARAAPYMNLSKRKTLRELFLILDLTTSHLSGCVIAKI